jgi:signal transduction histidine kinase/CheY-like chemotaxis protein
MTSHPAVRRYDHETIQVLEDLVRDSLRVLLPTTAIVTWVWVSAAVLVVESRVVHGLAVLALVLVTVVVSYLLHRRYLGLTVGLYLTGLTAAVTIIALSFEGPAVLYLYIKVVLVTAMLAGPRATWGVAVASVALILTIGTRGRALAPGDLAFPLIFVLLTALTSWLSSRRLYTALAWALSMTKEAQKNAEEARERRAEVRSVLKSLEEAYVRLERANQALIFARAAAEKAYRFKAEFVANVSHELRTPLNLIVGFSDMMATAPESYDGVPLPSQYRGDMMAIYRSARHLSDLINDVLDLSQIEAGRLPLRREMSDLAEIVDEATEIIRGLAEAKGLRLQVDLPDGLPHLRLDRTRIRQVLLNLLSNATRFTDRGWIRLRGSVEADEVRVAVEDSGRGVAHDKIAQAFEAFTQLDEDRAREGSGLGLAVSKSFVELHGGVMWIESAVGKGTTVGFSLPIPKSGKEVPLTLLRTAAPAPGQEKSRQVLVLHDDPQILSLLRRYVEGFQFVLADTADKAVEAIQEALPMAIVTDASWSERWARGAAEASIPAHLPVLTCPLPSLRRLGLLLGATDYLAKPITHEDLSSALARLPGEVRSVLVVDDDRHLVRLLARMLMASDPALRVLEASGALEGLELARSQRPDLILLDLLMPEVSGFDFLEELRRDETVAGTPVVVMSARPIEQESTPIQGEVRLARGGGLRLTETLQAIEALLAMIDESGVVGPASGPAPS